ncbi:hypothetical protein KBC55_02665 [Patescibacteria group bacterium]|nr:hypothetical protein [Patescibacteria group bacterium]
MKKYLVGLCLLALVGTGCLQEPPTTPPPSDVNTTGWQTYNDYLSGFQVRYPGNAPVNFETDQAILPEAVGQKDRTLNITIIPTAEQDVDQKGCVTNTGTPESTEAISLAFPTCLSIHNEGAAGSTYRTYTYNVDLEKKLTARFDFTIRYATSVQVYAGCETDEDLNKQACIDLAFNEERDTELFSDIMSTLTAFQEDPSN